jgi:hypothetical protein
MLPKTLREAYAILDLLNGPNPAAEERRRRLLAIRYEGEPLGDHEPRMRSTEPGETEYRKDFGEAVSFAHVAVGAGIDEQIADMVSVQAPEPDLLVTLTDGTQVYVEVAQVTEQQSARSSNTIRTINRHIHNRAASDPAFAAARTGRHVMFKFANVPPSRETKAVADEMVDVLYSTDFATVERGALMPVPTTVAPKLSALGVRYAVLAGSATALTAQGDAHWFDPNDSIDDLDARLADKMSKVYVPGKPIWLALPLNDLMQVPQFTMEVLRTRVPTTIGQFERVLVGTMEAAIILT